MIFRIYRYGRLLKRLKKADKEYRFHLKIYNRYTQNGENPSLFLRAQENIQMGFSNAINEIYECLDLMRKKFKVSKHEIQYLLDKWKDGIEDE